MIICDSREKKNQNVISYFEKNNIRYLVQKLDTGDYMDSEKMNITIDRKQNLDELNANLCSADNGRFWREIRRSKRDGLKLYILCEHGGKIKTIKDVADWKSRYTNVSGRRLMEEIYRIHIAYGVEFVFCDKRNTGKKILEILRNDA